MKKLDNSLKLMEDKRKYLFEATHYAEPILEKGIGTKVFDIDGNEYLDLNAGQFCVTFGHGYEPFIKLVSEQLGKIYHTNTGTLTPEIFTAAEEMAQINSGDLNKTIFLSTGSEANECALRFAKAYTKRTGVIALDKGYHGLTLASQGSTMGGQWAMPIVPNTVAVRTPDLYHLQAGVTADDELQECLVDLESKFESYGNKSAAMIMEPIVGVGGMIPLPSVYLKRVRELCDEYGVVLIFDECQCGFGRCGDWFAYKLADVIPDMVTTAKAMAMGFAVSAVTFSEKIAKKVEFGLTHFSSHQNDPLAAAIVSFVINEIKSFDLINSNIQKGKYLLKAITEICETTELLCNPRGVGLMCAFDLNDQIIENYREASARFISAMQENGVLLQAVRQGRTFRLMPNYYIANEEIDVLKVACLHAVKSI